LKETCTKDACGAVQKKYIQDAAADPQEFSRRDNNPYAWDLYESILAKLG
jgi:hypothetical protein